MSENSNERDIEEIITMMDFTEGIFTFPIRVYDSFSVRRLMREEEEGKLANPEDGEWVIGYMEMPINEYQGMRDCFSPGRTPEEVAKNGFDLTMIYTRTLGDYVTPWSRKKMRDELNKFVKEYEKKVEEQVKNSLQKKFEEAYKQSQEERKSGKLGFFEKIFGKFKK